MAASLKIAVTGATGFLGANIVAHALAQGHKVRALKRATSSTRACVGLEPDWVVAELGDRDSLIRAFKGASVVIHTAALVAFWPGRWAEAYAANVIGTRNVVAACLAAGVERLIYTGTISAIAIGRTAAAKVDEESPFTADREKLVYHKTKQLAEIEANAGIRQGLAVTTISPSLIFGQRDINLNAGRILREAKRGIPFYLGGGSSICDGDEVAKAHLAAIERGKIGHRYVTGGENIANRRVAQLACEIVGAPYTHSYVRIPRAAIHLLGWVGDRVSSLTGEELLINSGVAADATLYAWTDSSKAQRELGYSIPGARVSMEKCYKWLKEQRLL